MNKQAAPVRTLLVEDHDIVREGTRRLLERAEGVDIVGEAGDGESAVRLAHDLLPDIVIMDVRMPMLNGLEATRRIKAQHPEIKVLVLSAYEDDEFVFPLLEAGADGYLLKTTNGSELVRAIHAIVEGQSVLDPHITGKVVSHLTGRRAPLGGTTPGQGYVEALTEREIQVLQAVADGLSNKEIAEALTLSTYTVQVHLRNIFGKLGVSSRTGAVTSALRQGWVRLAGRSDRDEER
jgi:DNA-binding NarL/FixJ family response regulator